MAFTRYKQEASSSTTGNKNKSSGCNSSHISEHMQAGNNEQANEEKYNREYEKSKENMLVGGEKKVNGNDVVNTQATVEKQNSEHASRDENTLSDEKNPTSDSVQSCSRASVSSSENKHSEISMELVNFQRSRNFKHHRHSLWYRLRHGPSVSGVVVLDPRHPLFPKLVALTCGIRELMTEESTPGPKDQLESKDYSSVIRRDVRPDTEDTSHWIVESLATSVFATIRRAAAVKESMYLRSLATPGMPVLEFISNSRSGQEFFLSHDTRYLIKTNKERDIKFLISILGDYLQHFLSYPHSLLVKYLGCYSVQRPGKKKKYFLIMQNIFYPGDRIEDRFDLKGCTAGRYQKPHPSGTHSIVVLKDQNFFQEELELGSQKTWFIDQIRADSQFLQGLNVMDYSLLVGRQKLRKDELEEGTKLPQLVSRVTKSFISRVNGVSFSPEVSPPCIIRDEHGHDTPMESRDSFLDNLPGMVEVCSAAMATPRVISSGLRFPRSLSVGTDRLESARLRLLPDCSNALHIIDGPNYRYFFGIVDFLTHYTCRQKMARLWKMVKYGCGEHSTMPPDYYSQRFINNLASRVR